MMPTVLGVSTWNEIQRRIWDCDLCVDNKRVACNIRQQTEAPVRPVKLILIGVAPPYVKNIQTKAVAKSAINDPKDNLRTFVQTALSCPWETLLERGLYLIHGVKCAIVPENRHQNPPTDVIDACAPPHFVQEILITRPSTVVVFGKAPFRALLRVPDVRPSLPQGLNLSCSVARLVDTTTGGLEVNANNWHFRLYGSPFPLQAQKQSAEILREAAREAGVLF